MQYLVHYGVKGMHWGVRRYQNPDGSLTPEGREKYGTTENFERSRNKRKQTIKKVAVGTAVAATILATGIAAYKINNKKQMSIGQKTVSIMKDKGKISVKYDGTDFRKKDDTISRELRDLGFSNMEDYKKTVKSINDARRASMEKDPFGIDDVTKRLLERNQKKLDSLNDSFGGGLKIKDLGNSTNNKGFTKQQTKLRNDIYRTVQKFVREKYGTTWSSEQIKNTPIEWAQNIPDDYWLKQRGIGKGTLQQIKELASK